MLVKPVLGFPNFLSMKVGSFNIIDLTQARDGGTHFNSDDTAGQGVGQKESKH
jgi:hypothetical protein